jgi:hypothetical protein
MATAFPLAAMPGKNMEGPSGKNLFLPYKGVNKNCRAGKIHSSAFFYYRHERSKKQLPATDTRGKGHMERLGIFDQHLDKAMRSMGGAW